MQFYTSKRAENARAENGNLIIEARKEDYNAAKYTSARLISKNKGDWKYGRIEARAKLPAGTGMWPAIWMLPTHWKYGGWPHSGEIDIMENVGYLADSAFSSVHTGAYNHGIKRQTFLFKKSIETSYYFQWIHLNPRISYNDTRMPINYKYFKTHKHQLFKPNSFGVFIVKGPGVPFKLIIHTNS